MKRMSISLILIFFALNLFLYSQPKLMIIGGETYNWGQVKPKDSPLKANIQLVNTGDKKLIISDVRTSCGCTTAPLDKKELEPGDTTVMRVSLNIISKKGWVDKSITISSNDTGNRGKKTVYVKAEVMVDLEITPNYLTFGEMTVGIEKQAKVVLKNYSNKDIVLSDFEPSPANLIVNVTGTKILKAGSEIEIIAKGKPEKEGSYNCNLKFRTSHPDYPDININGYGNVKKSPLFNN